MAVPLPGKLDLSSRATSSSGGNVFNFAGAPAGFFGGASNNPAIAIAALIGVAIIAIAYVKTKKRG